jgi:hypothetical protein
LLTFVMIGLVVIVAGSIALARNVRESRGQAQKKSRLVVTAAFELGLILAAGSFLIVYPSGENARVVGFPLPAAVWERHGGHWMDFVGPLMLPLMCANAWFAYVLPHPRLEGAATEGWARSPAGESQGVGRPS